MHFNLDDGLRLSDEYFDLLLGESREIIVYGVPEGFGAECLKPACVN